MKKYLDFTVEDFVQDEYFIRWVLGSDASVHSFWTTWLADHPQQVETVARAKQIISEIKFKKFHPTQEAYHRIWETIDQSTKPTEEAVTDRKVIPMHGRDAASPPRRTLLQSKIVAASSLAGLLLLPIVLWFFFKSSHVTYVTDYGEIKTIVLPDNSTVELNANSSLSFIDDWRDENLREVWLNGEGFFSVVHQADDQKFVVHVDALQIEVIGTEFNVSNRREKARVVLTSGKIRLDYRDNTPSNLSQSIFMDPGEMVEMPKSGQPHQSILKKRVNTEAVASWRNNQLIFDSTPIAEVIVAIQDQFGIDIVIHDASLAEYHYTGTIPLDDLDIFLTTLSKSFNIEIVKNEQQITIRKRSGEP